MRKTLFEKLNKYPFLYNELPIFLLLVLNFIWLFMSDESQPLDIPSYDAVFFTSIAYNILHFGDLGWIAYHEPIFHSIAIAGFSFFTDTLLLAALLVSKVSILLLIVPTYLLAKELFGKKVGLISALLVTGMPHIRRIAYSQESEALYTLLLTSSMYLFWLTYKKQSRFLGVITGIMFTLAYLTRSEGLFILFFLSLALIIIEIKKKTLNKRLLISLIMVVVVFFISSLPYFLFLRNHYGTWTLGAKTSGIYFWVRDRNFNDPDPERLEWGLSPKGELNLISMTSRDLINYWLKDPEKSIRVYLKNMKGQIPGFIPNTSALSHFPQVYPVYFAVPLIIGILVRSRRRETMGGDFYLLSVFSILFIYPFFTEGWARYLLCYSPIFMILTASGLNEINGLIIRYSKKDNLWNKAINKDLLIWLFIVIVSTYHFWVMTAKKLPADMKRYNDIKNAMALETKKAGKWAQKRFPPRSNYMVQWTRLPYYLGRWTAMPVTSYERMVWYARKNRVDYLVFETSGRGESDEIVRVMGNTPDMEVADVYESPTTSYGVVFLRLKK